MNFNICMVRFFFELFGPIMGFLAAPAWMTSAWYGRFTFNEDTLESTMASQSRWNAYAAIFASIAALVQLATGFMPACRASASVLQFGNYQ
jgi:hypothetical protein